MRGRGETWWWTRSVRRWHAFAPSEKSIRSPRSSALQWLEQCPSLCQHSAACPSLEGVRSGCGGRGGRCGRGSRCGRGGCEVRGVRPYRPLSLYRARPCGGLPNAEMQRDSKAGAVGPPLISPPRSSHRSTAQGGGQGGSPLAARGARTQVHGPPSSSAALKIELELEAWD
jgi:hypothetical protein